MKKIYRGAEIALLRAPAAPCSSASRHEGSAAAFFSGNPAAHEALLVASVSAAGLLGRDPDTVSDKQRLRGELTLTRYLVRMSTRPTPFGLFSGVAPVRFGRNARVVWERHRQYKVVRPDMAWLRGITSSLEQRIEVMPSLRVGLNNLCFRRGGRLVLPFLPLTGEGGFDADREGKELSLGISEAVQHVLDSLAVPIQVSTLQETLQQLMPSAPHETVVELLAALVRQGILVTNLHPPLNVGDPLGYVRAHVQDSAAAHAVELAACQAGLQTFERCRAGEGIGTWQQVTEKMRGLRESEHVAQVDLALGAEVQLPRSVVGEAERAATVLWRASAKEEPGEVRDYRARFLERYGSDEMVALRELLDPDLGLGPMVPPSSTDRREEWERSRILGDLAASALADGHHEVSLDDALVDRLFTASPAHLSAAPPAVDLYATLLAPSTAALTRGDFTLVVDGAPWGRVAGATMGRFAHVLPETANELGALAARVTSVVPRAVDLYWQVKNPRLENVARVPTRYQRQVNIGGLCDLADPRNIGIDDIFVGADHEGFRLFSQSWQQEIHPVHGHQLVWRTAAPSPAKFLVEAFWSRMRGWPTWSWGNLDALPFLPRVRFGKSVLSRAQWRLDDSLCRGPRDRHDWLASFDQWRKRHRVPDVVAVGHSDQMLTLNLRVVSQRDLLWDEIVRKKHKTLYEAPGNLDSEAHGWLCSPDGPHVGQVVFPLVLAKPPAQSETQLSPSRPASRVAPRLPGGEWLYAKVYTSARRQNDLLTHRLPDLLAVASEYIERWFFLRYADPEPHLRIRFQGVPSRLNLHLLPLLHDWVASLHKEGLARRLVLDTYVPEAERYGDPRALHLAENVFHTDSLAVLHQLAAAHDTPAEVIAAAHCIDLARQAHHPHDWAPWLLHTYPRSVPEWERDSSPPTLDEFITFDPPGPGPRILHTHQLAEAWAERATAITHYAQELRWPSGPHFGNGSPGWERRLESILHMHCNRILGSQHLERKAYAIARKVVHTQFARPTTDRETP
ncbi:lantibiotic dehydratase [Streptomyces sp. KLMMK]|uniref:lantibiotic dehydratase n=1 Tax=Streptomyces sp. KLMMK TaxID=3109353 RepID=UPI0030094D3A